MSKLECKDISVSFNNNNVLNHISIDMTGPSIIGLIGPSGCGKSTLLKCFNRINELNSGHTMKGEILFDGKSVTDFTAQQLRRKVGMVFQRPTPFSMSVFDNVVFAPRASGIKDKEKLSEIAEISLKKASLWEEMKDRLRMPAFDLSGGQQQRLCIARALAVQPEVLLLDEPTSALDPVSTATIEETIYSLSDKMLIVLVSHNMRQVKNLCRKTAYFEFGNLIEYADTVELFARPKDKRTAKYLQQ